jgi:hypothetical protein
MTNQPSHLSIQELRDILKGTGPWPPHRRAALKALHAAATAETRQRNGAVSPMGPHERLESRLFGNPRKCVRRCRRRGWGFEASQVDGPSTYGKFSFPLFPDGGIELTDNQQDQLFSGLNWMEMVDACDTAETIEEEDFEGGPGMSDSFYWIAISDPAAFLRQLREFVVDHLDDKEF